MRETHYVAETLMLYCLLLAFAFAFSGCMPTRGWRFEIGVSPVSELNNRAGLKSQN